MRYWGAFFGGRNSDTRWGISETQTPQQNPPRKLLVSPRRHVSRCSPLIIGLPYFDQKVRIPGGILHYWDSMITESPTPLVKIQQQIPIRLYGPIAKQNPIRNGTYNLPAALVTSTVKSSQFSLMSRLILRRKFSRHDWVAIFRPKSSDTWEAPHPIGAHTLKEFPTPPINV